MAAHEIPNFGVLLAPFISQVPAEARPRFLALLERGAADRYREWAAMLPLYQDELLRCAEREDEIADRIEARFALDRSLVDIVRAPVPGARDTYYGVFAGLDVWDQLRIQAGAERQGAQAWRTIAAGVTDPDVVEELARCSALEEESADRLDRLITHHTGAR